MIGCAFSIWYLFEKERGAAKYEKLGWLSMCLFLLLFKPAFTQVATETETEMVQITLHKLLFPNGQLPKNHPNDGQEKALLQTYRGLNGVTFQVYDVTDSFYHLRKRAKR